MIIRQEKASDYDEVYYVIKKAFESAEMSDGNEQELVNNLRKGTAFIPELSLIAEDNGKIVGHIMFTKVVIAGTTELALAPLSVLPKYQHQGIGTKLVNEGHRLARQLGYGYSIVLGSESYYPVFGYRPADELGIKAPFEVPRENFMVCRLNDKAESICGTVVYAEEFGIGESMNVTDISILI